MTFSETMGEKGRVLFWPHWRYLLDIHVGMVGSRLDVGMKKSGKRLGLKCKFRGSQYLDCIENHEFG